jgi:hypothetical protein
MSSGSSHIVSNYLFDPALGTITFVDYPLIELEGVKLITNINDGLIIYQFNDAVKNGTVLGNTLTLTYDTSAMSVDDALMIIYEAPTKKSSDSIIVEKLGSIDSTLKDTFDLVNPDEAKLRQASYDNIGIMSRALCGAQANGRDGITGALRTQGQNIIIPFSQDRLATVAYADVSGLSWMSFQIALVGTSSAVQPQFSNDGVTWVASLFVSSAVVTTPTTTAVTAVGLYGCPILGKFARLNITGTTAGRCAGTVLYSASTPPAFNVAVTGTVSSAKTNNAAVPAATNLGVLPAVANAASPVYTETFQTALSVDLAGALRVGRSTDVQPLLIKDKGQPLSMNLNGEVRVDTGSLRQLAERQILEAQEAKIIALQGREQQSSGSFGFEIR